LHGVLLKSFGSPGLFSQRGHDEIAADIFPTPQKTNLKFIDRVLQMIKIIDSVA